jgi:CO/xanthine dehydrogenase FAD-binding subunit
MGKFRFFRPRALGELLEYKKREGAGAHILGGGSNLLVTIKEGAIEGGTLVDIRCLAEIRGIALRDGWIEIGAGESIADIIDSPVIRTEVPFLGEALRKFANPLVRNMATLAGNIADSSPIGDTIPPLLVLAAEVVAGAAAGERSIPLELFFTGPGRNVLEDEEVILKIRFPLPRDGRGGYVKLGLRKGTSCSVVSMAVWLVMDNDRVRDIRIAAGGVAPTPRRLPATEQSFRRKRLDLRSIETLSQAAAAEVAPITDVRGSDEYRRLVSVRLLARAVREALGVEEDDE